MITLQQDVNDGLILAWRYLKRIPRIPELAIFAVLQSIMFVLLFAFVFGGAIPLPGYPNNPTAYREFLMPGIYAQTITFALATTAIGMADDMGKGIIDRFRSLPMARSAVLSGRTFSDVIYNSGILVVLMLAGVVVGWSVNTGISGLRRRLPAADAVHVRDGVGRRLARAIRAQRRSRPAGDLHRDLPADLHLERLRAAGHACPTSCSRLPNGIRSARSPHRCATCGATRIPTSAPACPRSSRSWSP